MLCILHLYIVNISSVSVKYICIGVVSLKLASLHRAFQLPRRMLEVLQQAATGFVKLLDVFDLCEVAVHFLLLAFEVNVLAVQGLAQADRS